VRDACGGVGAAGGAREIQSCRLPLAGLGIVAYLIALSIAVRRSQHRLSSFSSRDLGEISSTYNAIQAKYHFGVIIPRSKVPWNVV
jgi:hypothetical protein